jgi:hypothetical protein
MMLEMHKRNPLRSWYIGLALIVIGVGIVGWQMYATGCNAPPIAIAIILIGIPAIYLVLMYLALKSQP